MVSPATPDRISCRSDSRPVVGCPAGSLAFATLHERPMAMQHRTSRSRARHRRAQWKASVPALTTCANPACGKPTPPHRACRHCGVYRGRQVLPPAGDAT
ncbi:50S ribosomal protein L32 [Nonomuraea rubra]|uniref:50S ribosomal protein L32 n=2 Tax=Nonomuraea rubra TaxID=46180 RepID=UPI0035F098AC